MKNIKLLSLIFISCFLVNCDEEEYVDFNKPDDISDASWLLSISSTNTGDPYSINANTSMSFFNLSQGQVSQEWLIEEGNNYLNIGFKPNDTLSNFIDENSGLSKTTTKSFVLFNNDGQNTVRLINKFSVPTGTNISDDFPNNVIIDKYEENGLYVIDTKFVFDVYADILAAFTVLQDGNVIIQVTEDDIPSIDDSDTWPIVEVEASSSLTFVDNTTVGRPNGRSWISPDGTPSQTGGETAIISFNKLGVFDAGTFRSFRLNELPKFTGEKLIPLKVKVIPSSLPFKFNGALKEDENEVITFKVSGELQSFTGEEANFTVNVKNSGTGFDQDIEVESIKVSDTDATLIELTLKDPIFNTDAVTISYNGTGNIKSTDERPLLAFGPEKVQMFFGSNILPSTSYASYEPSGGNANTNADATNKYFIQNNSNNGNTPNGEFFDIGGDYIWQRVVDRAQEGVASMRYSIPDVAIPQTNLFGFGLADGPDGVQAGTYRVSYWVFIDPSTTLTKFRAEFGNPIYGTLFFDISTVEKNKWVRVYADAPLIVASELVGGNRRNTLRVHADDNPGVTGAQLMYFDNLALVELEQRP